MLSDTALENSVTPNAREAQPLVKQILIILGVAREGGGAESPVPPRFCLVDVVITRTCNREKL